MSLNEGNQNLSHEQVNTTVLETVETTNNNTIEDMIEPQPVLTEDDLDKTTNSNYVIATEELKELADEIFAQVKGSIETFKINVGNFTLIIAIVLEKVHKYVMLDEQEKYSVAMLVLEKLVTLVPDTDENDQYYLRNIIPSIIQVVVNSSQGKLKLKIKKLRRNKPIDINIVVEQLYQKVKELIEKNVYTPEYLVTHIMVILGNVMVSVEQYPQLTNIEKKAIVVRIIDNLIEELIMKYPNMDDNLKNLLLQSKLMLPNVVDTIANVANTHFGIKQFKGLFKCCKCK